MPSPISLPIGATVRYSNAVLQGVNQASDPNHRDAVRAWRGEVLRVDHDTEKFVVRWRGSAILENEYSLDQWGPLLVRHAPGGKA